MKYSTFIVLGCLAAGGAQAATISYNEFVSGDLPYLYPNSTASVLNLGVGQNTVYGRLSSWGDFDTFAFNVPQATQLNSVSLSFGLSTATGYFPSNQSATYGLSSGIGLPYAPYPNGNYAQKVNFSTTTPTTLFPLAAPLGAGTYTIGDFIHNDFSSGFVDYAYTLNVQSLAPPPTHTPVNYGLFIGVRDEATSSLGIKTTLNDNKTATELANEFAKMPNSTAFLITRDLTIGEGLTKDDISAQLKLISDQIKPNDNLVIYIGSHGGSYTQSLPSGELFYKNTTNNTGLGNEFLSLGNNVELGLPGLTDKALTSILSQFPKLKDIQKMTFIDACHSGGFWASGDSNESSQYDLNSLNKIALFAASSENNVSYSSILLDGQSYFGIGLKSAWVINPITGKYFSDGNGDGNITQSELQDYLNGLSWLGFSDLTMFENSFGDTVPFDPNLIKFDYHATPDFAGVLNVTSVPEPQTLALLFIAIFPLFSRYMFASSRI